MPPDNPQGSCKDTVSGKVAGMVHNTEHELKAEQTVNIYR